MKKECRDIMDSVEDYLKMKSVTDSNYPCREIRDKLRDNVSDLEVTELLETFEISQIKMIDFMYRSNEKFNSFTDTWRFNKYAEYMIEYLGKLDNRDDQECFKKIIKFYFTLDGDREIHSRKLICSLMRSSYCDSIEDVYNKILDGKVYSGRVNIVDTCSFSIPMKWEDAIEY